MIASSSWLRLYRIFKDVYMNFNVQVKNESLEQSTGWKLLDKRGKFPAAKVNFPARFG